MFFCYKYLRYHNMANVCKTYEMQCNELYSTFIHHTRQFSSHICTFFARNHLQNHLFRWSYIHDHIISWYNSTKTWCTILFPSSIARVQEAVFFVSDLIHTISIKLIWSVCYIFKSCVPTQDSLLLKSAFQDRTRHYRSATLSHFKDFSRSLTLHPLHSSHIYSEDNLVELL